MGTSFSFFLQSINIMNTFIFVFIAGAMISSCYAQVSFCDWRENPLGTCECNDQLFVNDDCTQGFFCYTNTTTPAGADGCFLECIDGYTLYVDPRNGGSWRCIPDSDAGFLICPNRQWNTECACPDCDIGACECEGQIRVSQDCRQAKYCNGDGSYQTLDCYLGQIVKVNVVTLEWYCDEDDGRCPGAFNVGCDADPAYPTFPSTSTTTTTTTTTTSGGATVVGSVLMLISSFIASF